MKKLFISVVVCFVLLITVSIGYTECEGDINCSGTVDGSDLAIFASDFGASGCGTCDDVIARMEQLEDKVALLEELLQHFTREGNDIYIEGANLHVRDGSGDTDGTVNGLGNLIVGYNEYRGPSYDDRSGSHNVVVGRRNNFGSYGGLVVGNYNTITGAYSSVSGGTTNTASGEYASVSGGRYNKAEGYISSVSGGYNNTGSGSYSSVSGGYDNEAFSDYSSVSGGRSNTAGFPDGTIDIGIASSVSGGRNNTARGDYAVVSGGGGRRSIKAMMHMVVTLL